MSFQGRTDYPSIAQQTAQYNRTTAQDERVNAGNDGNLWASGLSAEEQMKMIFFRFQKKGAGTHFFMQVFMRFFGNRFRPAAQTEYGWYEQDKLRVGTTVISIDSGVGTPTVVIDTGRTYEHMIVNDVLQSTAGWTARISNVDASVGTEKLTLTKLDGTNFTATDIVVNEFLGFSTNLYPEGSSPPKGRTWRPEPRWNQMQISRRTSENTGDARTSAARVALHKGKNPLWVESNELITMGELLRDIENGLLWGRGGTGAQTDLIKETYGIVPDIQDNASTVALVAGQLAEADVQTWFRAQNLVDANNEFLGLFGSDFCFDFQDALRSFIIDGGVNYGDFASKKKLAVGLDINQYRYASKVLNMKEYHGFNDSDVTGTAPAGPTATRTDFKKFALMLNMGAADLYKGESSEEELISYRYKAYKGVNRLLVTGHLPGMSGLNSFLNKTGLHDVGGSIKDMAQNNVVATGDDKDQFFALAQYGVQLINTASKHGSFRAIS